MNESIFILHGNIVYSKKKDELDIREQSYIVVEDGHVQGVYETLPEEYASYPVEDYGDKIIIPGLVDLHVHAPQYAFRGLGMDLELLDWLDTHTFPEEAKFEDLEYARKAYSIFADNLRKSATTRAVVF